MATVTRPSYAAYWRAIYDRQDWALVERLARRRYSEEIDWKSNPEGLAGNACSQYLILRIWSHGNTSDLARYCLEVAHQQAQQAMAVNAFAETGLPGAFPLNRYSFLVHKIFIDGFVGGKPLDKDTAIQIAQDQRELAPTYGQREWDAYPQSEYLHAVELLLLVDEYGLAQEMLKQARSLRGLHVRELAEIDKLICKSAGVVRDNAEARDQYRRMFDLLRNPSYADGKRGHPAFLRQQLVMACMWQKFFEPGEGRYDYDRAIDLLWE